MSDNRQPGYDFFPPPPPPPRPSAPANPGPGPSPRDGHVVPRDGHVVPRDGHVVPRQGQWADQLTPVRQRMPRWVMFLIAGVAVFLVVPILAAVAIPVFLSQRMKAEYQATTVELPGTLNGLPRNTTKAAAALAKTIAVGDISADDVAVYGKTGPTSVIVVAVKPPAAMSGPEQDRQKEEFERSFGAEGGPLTLTEAADPGDLGGWIGCGVSTQGLDICLGTSTGSLVAVLKSSDSGDPVTLLRQVRAATVQKN